MAKIDVYIPDPTPVYDANNQQQIVQALNQIKNQLNTTYINQMKEEQERFTWFLSNSEKN
jgi:ABC-type dipeptide/oligopeptide/nickel transport system ATPase subunit|tara:strand:+ start:426 stop:605 length:180 start_codon:yes stop_codon:yes gene_type:complete